MGFNKNFVVKNGLEVNTSLIFADAVGNKVGIATTNPAADLEVKGTINAEDITVTGVGTFPLVDATDASIDNGYINVGIITNLSGSTLSFGGISTVGSLYIGANSVLSSGRQLQNIASLDATTLATIEAAIADSPNEFTNLIVTGVSTLGIVTGATYFGDGSNLDGVKIGVNTNGVNVGYGVSLLDFRGPGVSTGFYDATAGIATVYFQGGGGAGAIGIGSTFPGTPDSTAGDPQNGDLFYHIDYGRTFIYYDEAELGVGISTYWVDSSPYNQLGAFLDKTGDSMQAGLGITAGTASAPGIFFTNALTSGVFSPVAGETTIVSVGNTILNVNPNGAVVSGVLTATTLSGTTVSATTVSATSISATSASFSGDVSIGGTLTYEDVNNVDSIGIVTARSGVHFGLAGAGGSVSSAGNATFAGIVTATSFSGAFSGSFSGTTGVFDSIVVGSAVTANSSGIVVTGVTTATDFNSTSDERLKENITTVENAVEVNNQLRGVRFEWKRDGRPSYGVIAQELEQVLPELVSDTDPKTVNYNGIIGVLIEAVKELSARVDELENR